MEENPDLATEFEARLAEDEAFAAVLAELAREVFLEPGADLLAEVGEGIVEPDVHGGRAYNPT